MNWLFDVDVFVVAKINALECDVPTNDPMCIIALEDTTANRLLFDFVTRNNRKFFVALGVNHDFLEEHPTTWHTNGKCIKTLMHKKSWQLKVINDTAERGVALYQSYTGVLTNQVKQQCLLHLRVVEKHRLDFPDSDKSMEVQTMSKH